MFELAKALGAAALLTTLPGIALLSLRHSWGPLTFRLACIPWVSVLILELWSRLLFATTSNTTWWALALPPLLVGGTLWTLSTRGRRPIAFRVLIREWWLPIAASTTSLVVWAALLLTGHNYPNASVPTFDDGVRHGWFVARILHLGTLDAAKVTSVIPVGALGTQRGLENLRTLHVVYVVATPRTTLLTKYRLLASELDELPWLLKVQSFGDVTIYRIVARR